MRIIIDREQPFQVLATNFSIGPSQSGYDLQISADGVNFTTLFSVGANVTRMVTGVANGSFYRLDGNTDEDVVVNWNKQCSDGGSGGGSGSQGPMGPQGIEGAQGYQGAEGAQGPAGEGAQGGDSTTLQSVDVLNPEPLMGDVQAKRSYKTITGETTAEFTSGWHQDNVWRPSLITGLDSIDGITFVYGVGRYELACDSEGNFSSTLVDGEDSIETDGLYWNAKGDLSDIFTAILLDSEENTYLYVEYSDKNNYWEISQIDNDNISGFEIPSTLTGSVTYEYEEGVNYSDGIYQYDGEDWQKEGILVVDELPEVGHKDTIYSLDGVLYIWNPNAGYAANWYKPLGNTNLSEGTGLVYAYPIEGQIIFHFSRNNAARVFKFHNGDLVVYEADQETVVQTITLGNTFSVTTYGSSYTIDGVYEKNYIGFRRNNVNISIGMAWDGYVDGGHYEVFNVENHPYTAADYGIPSWDDKGNVIRKYTSIGTKLIYVNATGTSTSNRMTVLTNGTGNGPDRWFAPVTGGNAGQMLISGGENAAPVWSDWIKAVKITSDAYEALATKDPNTLYVIDDE